MLMRLAMVAGALVLVLEGFAGTQDKYLAAGHGFGTEDTVAKYPEPQFGDSLGIFHNSYREYFFS